MKTSMPVPSGRKMGDVGELLEEIGALLGRYGIEDHETYLRELAKIYRESREGFREEMTNPLMWGGRDPWSIWVRSGRYEDEEQARSDEAQFRKLIVELVDRLAVEGLASDSAISTARALRRLAQ